MRIKINCMSLLCCKGSLHLRVFYLQLHEFPQVRHAMPFYSEVYAVAFAQHQEFKMYGET
jgi:hypothetical protein